MYGLGKINKTNSKQRKAFYYSFMEPTRQQ